MAIIDIPIFFLGGCFGGAVVWHFKDKLQIWWRGADAFVTAAEAKIAAIKAAVK